MAIVLGVIIGVSLCTAALLFNPNRPRLDFLANMERVDAAPGDEVILDLPEAAACAPSFSNLYRPAFADTWRQTHESNGPGFVASHRGLWDTSGQSWAFPMACFSGPMTILVPLDAQPGRIAACQAYENCVVIHIAEP